MIDFDSIWRTQDEIRTVVNAVMGECIFSLAECIFSLAYSQEKMAIEMELSVHLDEDAISDLCCQFPASADYNGEGTDGSKFVFFL